MMTNSSKSFGRSCGKDTLQAPLAQYDTFQLDIFSGVELVSRTTNIRRKRRNWETRQRQSKAHKRAEREAKRKLLAQPEISHEAAARTDENIPVPYTSATNSLCCMVTTMCFFCKQCGAVNAGGTLRLLKSLCDGTGESRQKARRKLERGLMPDEQVTADGKRAS